MGLYLLWKEKTLSSGTALSVFQRELLASQKIEKKSKSRYGIGHTGTLDPFAEGLLLVGTGEGTKLLAPLQNLPKKYQARMLFGVSSSSFDTEGELKWAEESFKNPPLEELREKISRIPLGFIEQVPPLFSAVHVEGRRAYEWAREGKDKELQARRVEIKSLKSLGFRTVALEGREVLEWHFEVEVSSGTYIRALARDWGRDLSGFPGMLSELIRSQIGPFEFGDPLKRPGGDSETTASKYRKIQVDELRSLFDVAAMPAVKAEKLKKTGNWKARGPLTKDLLLQDEKSRDFVAWIEKERGSVGRIFVSCPFRDNFAL